MGHHIVDVDLIVKVVLRPKVLPEVIEQCDPNDQENALTIGTHVLVSDPREWFYTKWPHTVIAINGDIVTTQREQYFEDRGPDGIKPTFQFQRRDADYLYLPKTPKEQQGLICTLTPYSGPVGKFARVTLPGDVAPKRVGYRAYPYPG